MHSTTPCITQTGWVGRYLIKRFFRIAPLFYFMIGCMFIRGGIAHQNAWADSSTLLLNISFTFGLAPWTSIVWGGWTIGVEMLFYVIFPVCLLALHSLKQTLPLTLISTLISVSAGAVLSQHFSHTTDQYTYNWAYFSFLPNLCFFMFGIAAYQLTGVARRLRHRWIVPSFSLLILGVMSLPPETHALKKLSNGVPILWGIGFAALAIWQATYPSKIISHRLFIALGERSYSLYLLHPLLIVVATKPIQSVSTSLTPFIGPFSFFACAALFLPILFIVAAFSYRFIELPGIRIGRRLLNRTPALPVTT